MEEFLRAFPGQTRVAAALMPPLAGRGRRITHVAVAGMGGSALAADLLALHLRETKSPVSLTVHRDYEIRAPLDRSTVVFCCSWSGDTEETLAALRQAIESRSMVVAVTTGGKLARLAASRPDRVALVQIPAQPEGFQPRFGTGFFLGAHLAALNSLGAIKFGGKALDSLSSGLQRKGLDAAGRKVARHLAGGVPVVYASERMAAVARIWKIKLNENAKLPAFWNSLPEANHNEMIGFTRENAGLFRFMLIEDPGDLPRVRLRSRLTADTFRAHGYPVMRLSLAGHTALERALYGVMVGDWASLHLARARTVDPVSIPAIQEFKRRLSAGK